jgi:hypothetical protein
MKLGVMQPYLLPYIGYFQLINSSDKFVIFDDVNYIKKGWINRNKILLKGKEYLFTVPLENASQNKLINEIKLTDNIGWKAKLLKTFNSAYKKAPFFKEVNPILEEIIDFKDLQLSAYITNSIIQVCNYLEIKTTIVMSSVPYCTTLLKGQDKILEICRKEQANMYLNPIGGRELYDKETFKKNKIELSFIRSKTIKYKQFNDEFIPFLSIIDILMFNDKSEISGYLNEFELL